MDFYNRLATWEEKLLEKRDNLLSLKLFLPLQDMPEIFNSHLY